MEIATLAGGCFWCTEAVFQRLKGVEKVESGYSGGNVDNPTYEQVCNGNTGHAEAIQITYDPEIISFQTLLEVFWHLHDPTTLNKQGADEGTQYRSAIFYHTDEQKEVAEKSRVEAEKSGMYKDKFVTEITPFKNFYPADSYHKDYYNRNNSQGYCQYVIDPKITKLYKEFPDMVKED
jgi:peptide-methionine (S)-S-oxide reductase